MTDAGTLHARFRAFPPTTLDALLAPGTPVVLAPHADDESLGCGGLLAACAAAGRQPLLAILTDGCGSHPGSRAYPPERLRATREAEALAAAAILGLSPSAVFFLGAPDTALPGTGAGLGAAVSALAAFAAGATSVLTTWRHDPHCDHEAAAAIGAALAARLEAALLFYPVWGWTLPHDTPLPATPMTGWRLPVGAFAARKAEAIAAHRSQGGALITDDPGGFTLPAGFLRHFDASDEVFFAELSP